MFFIINLINGDCLEILPKLKEKSINLVIADLPYGKTKNKWDKIIPFEKMWEEVERVTKNNAAIIFFSQGIFYVDLVNSNRKNFRYDIIWDKVLVSGHLNAGKMPLRTHEQLAVFYKKLPIYNPQFTEGIPLHSVGKTAGITIKNGEKNGNYGSFTVFDKRAGSTEKYPKSIQKFQKPHPSLGIHPTAKPVELLEWLIKTYSNENDTVLDFCMGSGSTGVACINTKRNFVGIEINEKYFKKAKERIKNEKN